MSSDLQFSAPRFFCLWPTRARLCKSTFFKMCFLPSEKLTFYNFGRATFHKTPPGAFQSAPFPKKSAFRGVTGSSWPWHRQWRFDTAATPQRLTSKFALPSSQIDFLLIFKKKIIPGHDLLPQPKKTNGFLKFLIILTAFWQNSSLFFCSRHRSAELHLGHFNWCVGLHSLLKPIILGPETSQNGSGPRNSYVFVQKLIFSIFICAPV